MDVRRLIGLRERLNLTQEQIALKIGVSRSTYSVWEIKKDMIPLKHLNTISNTYDISLDYLTGISNTNNSNFKHISLDKVEIGKRLRSARKRCNLTQQEIAIKLNTTHSNISAYENGKTLILTAFIIEFSKITNTSIDYLCCKTN